MSHLTAWHDALTTKPDIEVIVIVEGDVRETTNTYTMVGAVLANMFGNRLTKKCQYVALTFSDWHARHAGQAPPESLLVHDSRVMLSGKSSNLPEIMDKNK